MPLPVTKGHHSEAIRPGTHPHTKSNGLWIPRLMNILPTTFDTYNLLSFSSSFLFVSPNSHFSLSFLSSSLTHLSPTIAQMWAPTPAQPSDHCSHLSRIVSENLCFQPSSLYGSSWNHLASLTNSGLWHFCPLASLKPREPRLKVPPSHSSFIQSDFRDAASIICISYHVSPWKSPFTSLFL